MEKEDMSEGGVKVTLKQHREALYRARLLPNVGLNFTIEQRAKK